MNDLSQDQSRAVVRRHGANLRVGLGFRMRRAAERCDRQLVLRLAAFATPDIADKTNQLYVLDPAIRAATSAQLIAGTACTVRVAPGDNLMVHKALDIARPGQIVVVDTGGGGHWAVLGDLVSTKAKHRGIAGFVVDGYIRDVSGIQSLGFPVFARGSCVVGPTKNGPGEINYPVCCGGVVVNPGDIVVGDENGVVVIPPDTAADLVAVLEADIEAVESYHKRVARGEFSNDWVDRILDPYDGIMQADLESDASVLNDARTH
jgi:RraA family protein